MRLEPKPFKKKYQVQTIHIYFLKKRHWNDNKKPSMKIFANAQLGKTLLAHLIIRKNCIFLKVAQKCGANWKWFSNLK